MPKSPRRSAAQRVRDLVSADDVLGTLPTAPMSSSSSQWPEIAPSLLEERRSVLPPFPTDLMPLPWRDWLSDTVNTFGADQVLYRLRTANVVREVPEGWRARGRPTGKGEN